MKVKLFNQEIVQYLQTLPRLQFRYRQCVQRTVNENAVQLLRGYTGTYAELVRNTSKFIGTKKWMKKKALNFLRIQKNLVTLEARNKSVMWRPALYNVNEAPVTSGIKTFILSMRSSEHNDVINVHTPIKRFYDCFVPASLKNSENLKAKLKH